MHQKRNHAVRNITILTLAAMMIIVSDVFFVSIGKIHLRSNTNLAAYAEGANTITEKETAFRGNIYDRSGNIIAEDNRTYNIVCILDSSRPGVDGKAAYVVDREKTAETLSVILKMDKQKILDFLSQADKGMYQTELGTEGRNLSKTVKEQIEATDLTGIEFTDSVERVYPYGEFASNLLGYAQANDEGTATEGKMGLELYLNSYLTGKDGYLSYQVDKNGYNLPGMKGEHVSAVNGDNVYLTLDAGIQEQLEDSMQQTLKTFPTATNVWGAVMEVNTGKIVAWGQTPSFNPNDRDITEFQNYGAQLPYEPGSVLKTFCWAAAINENKYDGATTTDGYRYCYGADAEGNPVRTTEENSYGCIYNAYDINYGNIDYDSGLYRSLNSVAVAVQNEAITPQINLEYLQKFGFFTRVDTDGVDEATGTLNFNTPADRASISYGQGSSVTTLQLLQAYSAVFGNGTMVKPHFVESIRDSYDSSKVIYQAETKQTGTPISAETAKHLQTILYETINNSGGTGKYYQIPECKLIGKTGTTQVAVGESSYESNISIASVMIGMPADNPQVIVYYAFRLPMNRDEAYYTDPVTSLLRKVAMTYGFTNDNSTQPSSTASADTEDIQIYDMPSLLNHSVAYAQDKLAGTNADVIVLGNGGTVIDQYPKETGSVSTGQRVFLLTDTTSFYDAGSDWLDPQGCCGSMGSQRF
jgi:penicillin-binding protein 2B